MDPRAAPSEAMVTEALAHADALYRLARHLTRSDDDAADLVQDTYARALGATSRAHGGSTVRAWLFRILRNTYIDAYRRARKNPVESGLDDDAAGGDAHPRRECLRGDGELEHLRGIVAEEIEAALMSLSFDARAIVLLDLEGLTETEIADVLDCPLGTVKSRLARARAALRVKLEDYRR